MAAAVVLCLSTCALAAVTVNALPAQASTQPYGAFAYSPSNWHVVAAGFGSTATAAETAAIKNCGKSDCIAVTWFKHAYAQFDVSNSPHAWGDAYSTTPQGATKLALSYCEKAGGTVGSCKSATPVVDASHSSASTGADLLGRACMINAPSGVLGTWDGISLIGHVGWAFLVNRDSGSWYFGANEGPSDGPGTPSKTWATDGNWAAVVSTFSHLDGGHYYLTYRCESMPLNDGSYAQSVVSNEEGANYNIPFNDCLSNAVDVLAAYGVTGLPSDQSHPVPNTYYANLPGFEAAGSL